MNRPTSFFRLFVPGLTALLLLVTCATDRLNAQGFLRPYPALNSDGNGSYPMQLTELPNGHYQLATGALYNASGNLHWMEIGIDGQPVSLTTHSVITTQGGQTEALRNFRYWAAVRFIDPSTSFANAAAFYLHDAQGAVLASDTIGSYWGAQGNLLPSWSRQNDAGDIFVAVNDVKNLPIPNFANHLYKYSANGILEWSKLMIPPGPEHYFIGQPQATPDGGVLFSHGRSLDSFFNAYEFRLTKLDSNGGTEYSIDWPPANGTVYENHLATYGENAAGETFFTIHPGAFGSANQRIIKRLPSGDLAWMVAPVDSFDLDFMVTGGLIPTADGGAVACFFPHELLTPSLNVRIALIKINADGTIGWHRFITNPAISAYSILLASLEDSQGNILLGIQNRTDKQTWVMKLGPDGESAQFAITGTVTADQNDNCAADTAEPGLAQVAVALTDQDGLTTYTLTNSLGQFALPDLDTGSYTVFTVPPPLWAPCVDTFYTAFPQASGDTAFTAGFVYQPLAECPYMQVDVSSTNLRPCMPATAALQYCNQGTVAAVDAWVEVELDPLLTFTGASLPATVNGSAVAIALGTVGVGQCGTVQVQLAVDCQAVPGQTLCLEAHISPDTLCLPAPLWTGAQLEVEAECLSDSVRFRIVNRGAAASTPGLDYVIIDDHVITRTGTLLSLAPDGFMEITESAANGNTLRLRVEQEPYHPVAAAPSVAVERCGAGPVFQQGIVNEFANVTGDPFTAAYCHEVTAAYDPNDKQALPRGFGPQHHVERGQSLDYTIRFQNTGTDTAFTVVLVDTLSAWLDPATVRPGAASHPYTWELSGAGILTFRFAHILLPDSNVNEPASHGFVQFSIDQRPDLPDGTLIENFADIYFDYNLPVRTNTVWHTIASELVGTATPPGTDPRFAGLRAHPTPARTSDVGVLLTITAQHGRYELIDCFGKTVRRGSFTGNRLTLPRVNLSSGMYLCRVFEKNREVGTAKIIWQD